MTTKKKGRGRPKGAPNKPKMELITEKKELYKNSDAFEIFCQADLVAQENEDFAINGLMVYGQTKGALQDILQWASVIPYPSIIVIPVALSNFLNNSLGIGADPHRAKRSDETSAFTGLCISSAAAVGTRVMNAGFHLSTKFQKLSKTPSPL